MKVLEIKVTAHELAICYDQNQYVAHKLQVAGFNPKEKIEQIDDRTNMTFTFRQVQYSLLDKFQVKINLIIKQIDSAITNLRNWWINLK